MVFYSTLAGLGWAGQQGYQRHTPFCHLGLMERGAEQPIGQPLRCARCGIEWIYMHGRLGFGIGIFLFCFFCVIGGGFWAKRAEREEDKKKKRAPKELLIYIQHLGVTATHSSLDSPILYLHTKKVFGFPLSAIVFYTSVFLLGVSYYCFFAGFSCF